MQFDFWQWLFLALAASIIGMSKSGVPGLGILNVAIFQNLLHSKAATGFGLPLLVVGDLCAIVAYRRHAEWKEVFRMIPWAAAGVVVGYFALGSISDFYARLLIGATLATMLVMHALKAGARREESEVIRVNRFVGIATGVLAGFISMIANAAGPIMVLYLLSMRLPKMRFMGVNVYFFTLLNLFKLPFLAQLDLVNFGTIGANLKLVPFVVCGSLVGYFFARKISQLWFERIAFWLTLAAVVRMLWLAFH